MPLYQNKTINDGGQLLLWKITEDEAFFLSQITLSKSEQDQLAQFKAKHRRLEWLAVRLLVKRFVAVDEEIVYNEQGKPSLCQNTTNVSVSHSKAIAGILLHQTKQPGLDIEYVSDRVKKIEHKFLSAYEQEQIKGEHHLEKMMVHWCAKETLLKIVGRKDIDFIHHLRVLPFEYKTEGVFSAEINLPDHHSKHELHYFNTGDFMVAYGW